MNGNVSFPAVAEHESRYRLSTFTRPEHHGQLPDEATESLRLFGAQFIDAFDVALGLCGEMS